MKKAECDGGSAAGSVFFRGGDKASGAGDASLSAVQSLAGSIDELGHAHGLPTKPLGVIGEAQHPGARASRRCSRRRSMPEYAPVRCQRGNPSRINVVVMPGQSGSEHRICLDASLHVRE